jgi:hypothetical protein
MLCLRRFVMSGEEMIRVEKLEIERFMALGIGRYEAIRAVEDAVDLRDFEALLATGCTPSAALESAR